MVHIEGDGNCGPRAISYCLYGHTEHHLEIRKNICEIRYKRMKQLHDQGQLSDEALAKAFDHYEKMSIDKEWTTD